MEFEKRYTFLCTVLIFDKFCTNSVFYTYYTMQGKLAIQTKKGVNFMCKNACCCALQIVISLVVAAVVGVLRYFGYIVGAEPVWAVFVVGTAALALLIAGIFMSRCTSCRQHTSVCGRILLAVGAIGTVITSIIALATLDAAVLAAAIISAFVALFAALLISGIIINALGTSSNDGQRCRM